MPFRPIFFGLRGRSEISMRYFSKQSYYKTKVSQLKYCKKLAQKLFSKFDNSPLRANLSTTKCTLVLYQYFFFKKSYSISFQLKFTAVLAKKLSFFLLNPYFLVYALNLLQQVCYNSTNKFSILDILNLVIKLRTNTYYPKILRKLHEFAKNGKRQVINLLSFRDQLIQHALYLILNPFYLNQIYSKKFGLYKNPHACVHQISSNWQNTP
jgi:hypothetical protein